MPEVKTAEAKTKFGGFNIGKLGSIFSTKTTIIDESKLWNDKEFGDLLLNLMSSKLYKEGFKKVIHIRREEILSAIKSSESGQKFERLSGRLQEIDSIEETIIALIKKGDDANRKLTESKET